MKADQFLLGSEGEFLNFAHLPSSTPVPQQHWQSTKSHNPVLYKSPCRRRCDLKKWEQQRAGAGDRVQGAGHPVQGAEHPVQGAGHPVQGAGHPVQGAGQPVHVTAQLV